MSIKISGGRFCQRVIGKTLRTLVIRAGFPYHKAPNTYRWLWVFVLLPFLEEATLNELAEKHGKELRQRYGILRTYPECFEKLVRLISMPLLVERLRRFPDLNETNKSRQRIRIVVDDTQAEKYGQCQEWLHKLFDHCTKHYMMGYNYVLLLVSAGDMGFPISFVLWIPSSEPNYRSKSDIVRDEITQLRETCEANHVSREEVEFLGDSAYCRQKVVLTAMLAGLRVITKPGNTHTFEFEGEKLTPREIIERVKGRPWKGLEARTWYQRVIVTHHTYGEVVLVIRHRRLKNQKLMHDVLLCTKRFYTAPRIHRSYTKRWRIELEFKYAKQYLGLGKGQFGKSGAIRSQLACVALAGLLVALFRLQRPRKPSFRKTVRLIAQELRGGYHPYFQERA